MAKDLKQKLPDKIEALLSKRKGNRKEDDKRPERAARYLPRIFLRFLTGVFPEVFRKRERIHVQKVQKKAQKEGQREPGSER